MNKNIAISYDHVRKVYRSNKSETVALKDFNLEIYEGEFFGLLGHNGAGKSTAINMLCHIVLPTEGTIKIMGVDVKTHPKEAKKLLGVVPQELYADSFFPLKLMLELQSKLSGVSPDSEWIHFLCERLALTQHLKKTSRELSGGLKRRMMIARALVHKPKILVLDEPTAGVDVELRLSMWDFIDELHRLGLTIILTTHYLEEAERFCERLAIVKQGELVTVKKNKELLGLGGKPSLVAKVQLSNQKEEEWREELDDESLASVQKAVHLLQSKETTAKAKITSLVLEKPSLEQVFLNLVGG